MPKYGHKLSEYIKMPEKPKRKNNRFRDEFTLIKTDPLVKKKRKLDDI
jgi:hypothetical protein